MEGRSEGRPAVPGSWALPVFLVLFHAAGAELAGQVLSVTPDPPVAGRLFSVHAIYDPGFPTAGRRFERLGSELRFTVLVDCGKITPPLFEEFTHWLAPLAAGTYLLTLYHEGCGAPGMEPPRWLLASREFEVVAPGYAIEVDPPRPTAGETVTLTVRHACPSGWANAVVDAGLVYLLETPFIVDPPPPCPPEGFTRAFELGTLAPGRYDVLLLSGSVFHAGLEILARFDVGEAPTPELLLSGGRFALTASWRAPDGSGGAAAAVALTADSGAFWFRRPQNLEVMAKALDGCAINGHRWLLAAGLTNLEVRLLAADAVTCAERRYENPQGRPFEPILDTEAFPCS
jgi:hypothetical protein